MSKQQSNKPKKTVKTKAVAVKTIDGKQALVLKVPKCVKHYLEASVNPFDAEAGACLPCDLFPLPSLKRKIFARGSFATGTTGFGFITLVPGYSTTPNNVNFTTSASVGNTNTQLSAFTNQGGAAFSNAPYTNTQFTNGEVSARVVAVGIRVRCTSSNMNRGGTYLSIELPIHSQDVATWSYTGVGAHPNAHMQGIPSHNSGDWEVAVCSSGPTTPEELQYSSSIQSVFLGIAPYGILIQSATPGATFDFEAMVHVEYTGLAVAGPTPSHASPQAFAKAVEAMKENTAAHGPVQPSEAPSIFRRFAEGLKAEMPHLINMASGVAQALMGNEAGLIQTASGALNIISDSTRPKLLTSGPIVQDVYSQRKAIPQRVPVIQEIDY